MRKIHRNLTSLFMTAIYLMIVLSPLTPLAMLSKGSVHTAGHCSGDCAADGCSLERSAAHTCCCWQQKTHAGADAHSHDESDISDKPPAHTGAVPEKKLDCCDTPAQSIIKSDGAESATVPAPAKAKPVTISSAPCGSGKLFILSGVENAPHLPFYFSGTIPTPEQDILTAIIPEYLTSRYADPPDPPPIIPAFS